MAEELETFRTTSLDADSPPPLNFDEGARIPPHSLEAEQAVLGCLMLGAEQILDARELLVAEDFYFPKHRLIYQIMERLSDANEAVDVVTVIERLTRDEKIAASGGSGYIEDLAANAPGGANLKAYVGIVRDKAILRDLIRKVDKITDLAYHSNEDIPTLLNDAEQLIFSVAESRSQQAGPRIFDHIVPNVMRRIEELFKEQKSVTGLETSFDDLDALTSGFQPSELIIIAGRPAMGKTSFAMNIATHAALDEDAKRPVVVFSLEMSAEALAMRVLSSLAPVNQRRISTGRLEEDHWVALSSAVNLLEGCPLYVDDSATTLNQMRARTRRVAREHEGKLGLVVVDYLQLMETRQRDNRVSEISDISRGLKALARELDCPLIALSQLNRSLELRQNKRPQMSDLRDSGAIEQDADIILFIYRDEVYDKDNPDNKGKAEVIISKQRNGPTGDVHLFFREDITLFHSRALSRYEDFPDN